MVSGPTLLQFSGCKMATVAPRTRSPTAFKGREPRTWAGALLDLPLTGEEKPSLEGPCRLLTFLLIYTTLLPLDWGLGPNSLKLIDPQLMTVQNGLPLLLPTGGEDEAMLLQCSTCLVDETRGQTKRSGPAQSPQGQQKHEAAGTTSREKSLHPTQASSLNLEARTILPRGSLETVKKL